MNSSAELPGGSFLHWSGAPARLPPSQLLLLFALSFPKGKKGPEAGEGSWTMETSLGSRSLGEESLQMWDLNKRLEAYLARVKYLEEENELLRAKIQTLKVAPQESSWKGKYEGQVAALRATLDQAFREKRVAELARDSLHEEVQQVKRQCRKERNAQEEAKQLLSLSKKEVEDERRAQLWLREKASQLEKEIQALAQAHQEEMAALDQEVAGLSWSLDGFRAAPLAVCFQPVEVDDYAMQLSSIWKGAVETYKTEVSQLETSLCEAKENLWRATEGNRQNQLQLQQLEKELAGLKMQKELLEESLSQQWQHQHGEAEKLQMAIESLEEEKRSLRVQIAQVLEDRQHLMHLKMSLSLEVATYRTLLEAESTRLQLPVTDFKIPGPLRGSKWEARSSQVPGVSLEEGRLGSRSLKLSPVHGMKRNGTPWLLKNHPESFAAKVVSLAPKSCRSPGAREFQKANSALQSQTSDDPDVAVGSPEQSTPAVPTKTEAVSWAVSHGIPPGPNSVSLRPAGEEESQNRGQKAGREHDGGMVSPTEAEGTGEKEEPYEEEEEKQPNEEPPGEASLQNVPYPTPLLTEVLEMAVWEGNREGICLEPSSLKMSGVPGAVPPVGEASTVALSPGWEAFEEEAGLEAQVDPKKEPSEVLKGSQHTSELNSGWETYSELQQEEGGGGEGPGISEDTGSSSLPQAEAPKEEQNGYQRAAGVLFAAPGETELGQDAESSQQVERVGAEGAPATLSTEQRDGPAKETAQGTGHPCHLEKDAPGTEQSWQPSPCPHPQGATGGCLEEAEGGAEGLEVPHPEALLLTEEEGRSMLWSPSQEEEEEEEDGFQAGMLGEEFLQEGGLPVDSLAPISPTTLSVTSGLEQMDQQVELEHGEDPGGLLCEGDGASPEPLDPDVFPLEETLAREKDSATRRDENTFAGEARTTGSRNAEEGSEAEASEEIPRDKDRYKEENWDDAGAGEARGNFSFTATVGPKTLHKREDHLGNEDTTEQEGFSNLDNTGPKNLQDNNLGNEDMTEQEGFSDVKNTGHEDLQENKKNIDNEDITHMESFPDMENIGCNDIHKDAGHTGNEDPAEQERFPGIESFGHEVFQEKENNWEEEDALDGESLSDEESSRYKALHKEEGEKGNGAAGEQEDLSVVENIGAEEFPKGGSVLGNEDTRERTGFSDVEVMEHQDLRTEKDVSVNEGTGEQVFSDTEIIGSSEVVCQPDVAWTEEDILRAEKLEREQAEENSSQPTELLSMQQKMEEEDGSPEASPVAEGNVLVGGSWETVGTEAIGMETEEAGGLLEVEDTTGPLRTNNLEVEENLPQMSEAQEGRMGTLAAEEQQAATEETEGSQGQPTAHMGQAPACEIQAEALAPAETPSGITDGWEVKDQSDPGSLQSQRDSSGSEDSLESWDTSLKDTCEQEVLEKDMSIKEIMLEETRPDHTPLHVCVEPMLAGTGTCLWLSESEEAAEIPPGTKGSSASLEGAPHILEGERQSSPQLQESIQEGENVEEQHGHQTEPAASQHLPGSQELPAASKDLEVVSAEISECSQESEDLQPGGASRRRKGFGQDLGCFVEESDKQPEEETSQLGSSMEEKQKPSTPMDEGKSSTGSAGEAEKGSIVPEGDLLDVNNLKQTAHKEDGGSLESSDGSITEEACPVSPLTSVGDLGEIVLEGDVSASGQRGTAEPKALAGSPGEFLHTSPLDHTPEEYLLETSPSSKDSPPCASTEAAVSVSAEGMKDSDILEIVEQALEFNQELIKAAEEHAEAELSALGGDIAYLPEEKGHTASVPSLETGEPQTATDVAKVSSLSAKDPTETHHLWVASDTNGLQHESGFSEFTKVLELNGISHLPLSHVEYSHNGGSHSTGKLVKKDATPQGFTREEMESLSTLQSGSHSPPQTPANDEAKRLSSRDVLLLPERGFPDHKGLAALDIMQAPEMEALPIQPPLEDEAQHLKFHPEAEEELWPQEDS